MKKKEQAEVPTVTITKGYKVTRQDLTCQTYKFEVGKIHEQAGPLVICRTGFHYCEKLSHCFSYYDFSKTNRVFEVEAYGPSVTDGNKSATLKIKLVRELTWDEVLKLANEGADNTGHSNTGDRNTGYRNTGDSNTGDSNTGDRNTGYRNTGDSNTGDSNTGDRNTGYRNTGDRNTGDSNTGDRNTGYSNTGDRNTGAFCTGEPPFPMFNKPSEWTANDFLESRAWRLMQNNVDIKLWVPANKMTEQEKKDHRGWEPAEGFYRDIPFKEAFANAWGNWNKEARQSFLELPNFDPTIFEFITSVKIDSAS